MEQERAKDKAFEEKYVSTMILTVKIFEKNALVLAPSELRGIIGGRHTPACLCLQPVSAPPFPHMKNILTAA